MLRARDRGTLNDRVLFYSRACYCLYQTFENMFSIIFALASYIPRFSRVLTQLSQTFRLPASTTWGNRGGLMRRIKIKPREILRKGEFPLSAPIRIRYFFYVTKN